MEVDELVYDYYKLRFQTSPRRLESNPGSVIISLVDLDAKPTSNHISHADLY